jgi:hypothetical protein
VVTLGSGRPSTFSSSLELTRKLPAAAKVTTKPKPKSKSKKHTTRGA